MSVEIQRSSVARCLSSTACSHAVPTPYPRRTHAVPTRGTGVVRRGTRWYPPPRTDTTGYHAFATPQSVRRVVSRVVPRACMVRVVCTLYAHCILFIVCNLHACTTYNAVTQMASACMLTCLQPTNSIMADLLTPRTLGRLIAMCSPARRCAYSAPSTSTAASCNITVYEQRAACNLQHTTCSATRLSLLSRCTLHGAATGQHPDACSMLYAVPSACRILHCMMACILYVWRCMRYLATVLHGVASGHRPPLSPCMRL